MPTHSSIPVVLAADNNYAVPMAVTAISLLVNAKASTTYEFFLLVPSDFSDENKSYFEKLAERYPCKINFVNMEGHFENSPNKLLHASNQSYYRLVLAEVIENYEKVIYLDVDLMVNDDLSELYSHDLGENYYGGVLHPAYYFAKTQSHAKLLEIPSLSSYINAGVLLVNLKKIREDHLTPKLVKQVENDYPTIDQDVINSLCYGKILPLPFKYNVMIKCIDFLLDDRISELYAYDSFLKDFEKPSIVHFANPTKPWQDDTLLFAQDWLDYHQQFLSLIEGKDYVAAEAKSPLISVVLATKNREKFLAEALDSILWQTLEDFELIVVDDGSTDSTPYLLNYYKVKDHRIKVITNSESRGISKARNIAHRAAQGKYIAVMDDDDISHPSRLQVTYDFLEHNPDIAVVGTEVEIIQGQNTSYESWIRFKDPQQLKLSLAFQNHICHSSTLIRKSFLDEHHIEYDENIISCVDYDLWVQILMRGGEIQNIDDKLQYYRFHDSNLTVVPSTQADQRNNVEILSDRFFSDLFGVELSGKTDIKRKYELASASKGSDRDWKQSDLDAVFARLMNLPYPSRPDVIPVAFASDDNYAPYLGVLLVSIMENASRDDFYEFLVLETRISAINKEKILLSLSAYDNATVKFVSVYQLVRDVKFPTSAYYTDETYYRFFVQTIFQFYSKVLYIDVDTIVNKDLKGLFETDVEGYLLAASINAGTVPHAKHNYELRGVQWRDYLLNTLKMKNTGAYFQAGVLVLNISEMKKFDLQAKALQKLSEVATPVLVDQDILNAVCEDKVKKISMQWDFLPCFRKRSGTLHWLQELTLHDRMDYITASDNPFIVHFASAHMRPWNNPLVEYADIWWKYARMTPFYESILLKCVGGTEQQAKTDAKATPLDKGASHHYMYTFFAYQYNRWAAKVTSGRKREKHAAKKARYKQLLQRPTTASSKASERSPWLSKQKNAGVTRYRFLGISVFKSVKRDYYTRKSLFGIRFYKKFNERAYYTDMFNAKIEHLEAKLHGQNRHMENKLHVQSSHLVGKIHEQSRHLGGKIDEQSRHHDTKLVKLLNQTEKLPHVVSQEASRAFNVYSLHQSVFPKYKNMYQGRDVVIVATGPSLNDYAPIEGAVHIGVNRAFTCDKISLDYLFAIDYPNIKHCIEQMNTYMQGRCQKFYGVFKNPFDPLNIPSTIVESAGAEQFYLDYNNYEIDEQFPTDLSCQALASFWTITFQAIQFALWTNPKKIYLVGCDESDLGHFNGESQIVNAEEDKRRHTIKRMGGWNKLRDFAALYYPDTEIISVNPVGLKGMFKEIYTDKE